jgi:hypothetical protein
MAWVLNIRRVSTNQRKETGEVPSTVQNRADVIKFINHTPDNMSIELQQYATETQIRGLMFYGALIAGAGDTSTVEAAINALLAPS